MLADVGLVEPEVLAETNLAGEAIVVLPCIAEQHGECHLIAGTQFLRFENEVRDLGEALRGCGVGTFEDDVALSLENVADRAHRRVFHTRSLYVGRKALSPAYPRFRET